MTTAIYIVLFLGIIGFVVYSVTRKRKQQSKPEIKIYPHYDMFPIDFEVVRLINEYRINSGLKICRLDAFICDVAYSHSQYMAKKKKPSHDFATERQNQFPNKRVGEIVAYNYQTAASVVAAWKNSIEHDKIMKSANYSSIGIAISYDDVFRPFYTVMFTS